MRRSTLHVSSGTYVRAIAQRARRPLHRRSGGRRSARSRSTRPTRWRAQSCCPSARCWTACSGSPGPRPASRIRNGVASSADEGRARPVRAAEPRRARSRSAPSTASTSATGQSSAPRSTPASCRRSSRSTRTRAPCSATRSSCCSTLERRLELLAELRRSRTCSSSRSRTSSLRSSPRRSRDALPGARSGRTVVAAGAGLPLRPRRAAATSSCCARSASTRGQVPARRGRLVDADPRSSSQAGELGGAARCSGGRSRSTGRSSSGDARGGDARVPDREPAGRPGRCSCRAFGIYAGAARRPRAAVSIGVNPHYGGTERRIEAFLLDFEGDLYGERLVVELWQRLRDERAFASEAELVDADRPRRRGRRAPRRPGRARAQVFPVTRIFLGMAAAASAHRLVSVLEQRPLPRLRRASTRSRPTAAPPKQNPGCPDCGYLGWIRRRPAHGVVAAAPLRRRIRSRAARRASS